MHYKGAARHSIQQWVQDQQDAKEVFEEEALIARLPKAADVRAQITAAREAAEIARMRGGDNVDA